MVTGGDDKKKEQGKGFTGLSSLVSDVDAILPPAAKNPTSNSTETKSGPTRSATQAAAPPKPPPPPEQSYKYKPPPQPDSGSSGGKWTIGIVVVVVVGFFALIGQSSKNTSTPAPAYSPPAQSTTPSYFPPAQPQVPSRPAESKPPVGQGLSLSYDQIAYCVAEDIRMNGARSAVNNYNGSDVDRFSVMVADYNSRCSNFRYRRGALESVRSSIEPYRSQLYSEGQQRLVR